MGLIEDAIQDAKNYTSDTDSGFGVMMTFYAPNGDVATTAGTHTKHRVNLDTEGQPTNAKKASITISEQLLTALDYPVRNSAGDVFLEGHRVKVKDSTGTLCEYAIREWFPDETMGLIVCILGEYEA